MKETPPMEVDVAIVGGGLGGLSLALGLQQRNIDCRVFECRPDLEETRGNFIGIATNGLTALNGIKPGLANLIGEAGSYAPHISFTSCTNTQQKPSSRFVHFNHGEFITVRWANVQCILAKQLSPGTISYSHKFISYAALEKEDNENYQVEARFKTSEQEEIVVRCKILVGADGLWSAVRKQMVGDSPRYVHLMNWSAILHDPDLDLFPGLEKGEVRFRSHCDAETRSVIANGGGYTMWLIRKRDETGDLANSVLSHANGKVSVGARDCKSRALAQIQDISAWKDLQDAILKTGEGIVCERMSMDSLPLDSWTDLEGHALLTGDAAHAQYMGSGQGARTAFEDSHQLAELLRLHCFDNLTKSGVEEAVKRFEEARIPRLRKMQEYATYETRVAEIQPEWTKGLNAKEAQIYAQEFNTWIASYPSNMSFDSQSTYFT